MSSRPSWVNDPPTREPYVSLIELTTIWRELSPDECQRVQPLVTAVSAQLRQEARKAGKDLDTMIAENPDFLLTVKAVVCDIVARTLMTSTNQEPMTQVQQSAGGYSAGGTFLVPGGGIFIKKSELARLGLRRQKVGVINFYGCND